MKKDQHDLNLCYLIWRPDKNYEYVKKFYLLIDFSLTVKAAILVFISGRGSVNSSAKQGK